MKKKKLNKIAGMVSFLLDHYPEISKAEARALVLDIKKTMKSYGEGESKKKRKSSDDCQSVF